MRLGIGSYTYTWAVGVPSHPPARPLTPADLLRRAEQLGVRVVQYCDNLPLTALGQPDLETLLGRARDLGIALEVGTRGLSDTQNLLAHLDLARKLGAPFVRLVVDSPGHEPSPEECVAGLRAILPSYIAANVKIALENHDRFSAATWASIVERIGPAHAGICLDTANSFGALEGPEAVVKTLAPYALNLHVKDFTIERVSSQMGFSISGRAAGQGRLEVPWLLGQLRAAGRDVNAILELWTPRESTLDSTVIREAEWAEESVRYLRQLIPD